MKVVCDLDGTLSEDYYRREYVRQRPKNYSAYHNLAHADRLNRLLANILIALINQGHEVVIWTGREEPYREITEEWLRKHFSTWYANLLVNGLRMRPEGDKRDTNEVKGAWAVETGWPDLVFDDRDKCVEWWRGKGIMCFQVD